METEGKMTVEEMRALGLTDPGELDASAAAARLEALRTEPAPITKAHAVGAIGWLSAHLAGLAGAWEGRAPSWFPEPPEWLTLWEQALEATAGIDSEDREARDGEAG